MFTFLTIALHSELMVSCFSVVTSELLQCCWNPGHCLWASECEWNFCSCVCDLWFHWIHLQCVDAILHPQEKQIGMYNQQDPSSPATVPVLWSSTRVILLVPFKVKRSGGWLWAEHFSIALKVLLAGCVPPFPSWFIFFKICLLWTIHIYFRNAYTCFCWTVS